MASIRVDDVTLDIPVVDGGRSLRKTIFSRYTGGRVTASGGSVVVRALENVTFELNDGDRLALIGHNGSGKSTLLKVISGIYHPTVGSVEVRGDVMPLFNASVGMDLDDTGLQNIFNVGLHLGYSPGQIAERTDDIAEFSELGEYLELPVRTYSSGMLLRLAFAIATTVRPEILIMDEGIGAGDARFARRAKERLEGFYRDLRILVMASHAEELVHQMCNKAIMLERGRVAAFGDVDEVLGFYRQHTGLHSSSTAYGSALTAGLHVDEARLEIAAPSTPLANQRGVGSHLHLRLDRELRSGCWYWELAMPNVGAMSGALGHTAIVGLLRATPQTVAGAADGPDGGERPAGSVHTGTGWRCDGLLIEGHVKKPCGSPVMGEGAHTVMVAFDADAGRLWIGVDGRWLDDRTPALEGSALAEDMGGGAWPALVLTHGANGYVVAEFVAEPTALAYTPPDGFSPLGPGAPAPGA